MTMTIEADDFLQYVPGIFWVVDRNMKYVAVEGEKLEEWQLDKKDVIGKTVAELTHENLHGIHITNHQKVLSDSQISYEFVIDKTPYECKLRYLPNKKLIVGVATDVTKAVEMTKEIEFQKQELLQCSTPVVPVLDHAVVMPIIGKLNLEKAGHIKEKVIGEIHEMPNIEYVIIDLSSVHDFDQSSHKAFEQIQSMLSLLGYQIIITGIQKNVAMEIVSNGSPLNIQRVYSNLKEAVKSLI